MEAIQTPIEKASKSHLIEREAYKEDVIQAVRDENQARRRSIDDGFTCLRTDMEKDIHELKKEVHVLREFKKNAEDNMHDLKQQLDDLRHTQKDIEGLFENQKVYGTSLRAMNGQLKCDDIQAGLSSGSRRWSDKASAAEVSFDVLSQAFEDICLPINKREKKRQSMRSASSRLTPYFSTIEQHLITTQQHLV
ncbi:hypothetical protein FLONG3_3944 [Fusarium longipes]|uniref:Uncharacterized protein n=1 Tax=Fusarium longipes TaxID=694270 RepID=A0A395T0F4_9HYPO|nr:hypothetical protein FLONG3_3944 [Fusarium longipes]